MLLHFNRHKNTKGSQLNYNVFSNSENQRDNIGKSLQVTNTNALNTVNSNFVQTHNVLLSTEIIDILDDKVKYHKVRVIFDSGSQSNFITRDINKLGLSKDRINILATEISFLNNSEV